MGKKVGFESKTFLWARGIKYHSVSHLIYQVLRTGVLISKNHILSFKFFLQPLEITLSALRGSMRVLLQGLQEYCRVIFYVRMFSRLDAFNWAYSHYERLCRR